MIKHIALTMLSITVAACSNPPQPDNWRAVVEWPNGESDIIEHSVNLGDCMASLAAFDSAKPGVVTYCERTR